MDILGGGSQQAAARAETMERIGAVNVTITPHATAGHFVVAGQWHYSRESLRALGVVLVEERLRYTKWALQARPAQGVLQGLRSLLVR